VVEVFPSFLGLLFHDAISASKLAGKRNMRAELAAWQQAKALREPKTAVDKAPGPTYVGCFKQGFWASWFPYDRS
jgi:hypothetical protein